MLSLDVNSSSERSGLLNLQMNHNDVYIWGEEKKNKNIRGLQDSGEH